MTKASFGPGALITAAFIGPGTVTVCTLAGVNDGYTLLWAMLFSVVICYLMQEMAARLGLTTRRGLAETLRDEIVSPVPRVLVITIVLCAIVIGNAAYEAGNISGGSLGLQSLTNMPVIPLGGLRIQLANLLITVLAFLLLLSGNYRLLERVLIVMVVCMSVAFVLVAVVTRPPIGELLAGLVPRLKPGQTLTVISLVGTTVVPYNLFLHASIVQEKWAGSEQLSTMRRDSALAIGIGGMISLAIIVSAASLQGEPIGNATELARSLEPVFGVYSRYILAIGLFAAGVTSAITAPMAASYVASGCLGWSRDLRDIRNRIVWIVVLLAGLLFSLVGGSPIEIIRFAQIANGILLPLIVAFLLWVVNRRTLLGHYVNTPMQNLLGLIVLIVVSGLAARSLSAVISTMT